MIMGFGNNVVSALAADINATQTTIAVMPGGGALFAACLTTERENSSNPLSVYAKITLMDEEETVYEICHLTAVAGDVLTVIRGQEATAAKGWSLNDRIANFATRGSENNFVQIAQLQSGQYTSATAGGTANALTVDLPSAYFVNGATDWELKTPLIITPTLNNTGACTVQLTLGGTVVGTFPIYKGKSAELVAGDILAGVPLLCLLDEGKTFFQITNPGSYSGLGTAAFRDVQISRNDITAGRLMPVGAFGLGSGTYTGTGDDEATVASRNLGWGVFRSHGAPDAPSAAYIQIMVMGDSANADAQRSLLAIDAEKNGWFGSVSTTGVVTWSKIFTSTNKPTAADTNAVAKTGDTMTGPLAIKSDGTPLSMKSKTTGSALYLLGQDADGSNLFYVGKGSNENSDVVLNNGNASN